MSLPGVDGDFHHRRILTVGWGMSICTARGSGETVEVTRWWAKVIVRHVQEQQAWWIRAGNCLGLVHLDAIGHL